MTKAGRGFGEPLIHSVPVAFLSHSSYLEPNGQVAVNQAIYMLMRRGAELEVAGKHILQREGRGEGTRGGEAEAGKAPPSSTATARLVSVGAGAPQPPFPLMLPQFKSALNSFSVLSKRPWKSNFN